MISYCKNEIVDHYSFTKVSDVIAGGKERYDSVYQGLLACTDTDYVFIHDGARPFITEEILEARPCRCKRDRRVCSGNAIKRYGQAV